MQIGKAWPRKVFQLPGHYFGGQEVCKQLLHESVRSFLLMLTTSMPILLACPRGGILDKSERSCKAPCGVPQFANIV